MTIAIKGKIPTPNSWKPDLEKFIGITGGITLLEKQVGQTTVQDISKALDEYMRLYKAGIASKAEILTLSRAFPGNEELSKACDGFAALPIVIGGPASVEMVDREGHLITTDALSKAFDRYMGNFRTRNTMVLHSDVQVGWALPAYISQGGQIFKSGVDGNGLFFITEIRDDTRIANKVMEQINEGKLKSYSIAGSATSVQNMMKGQTPYMRVDDLELAEVTVCEKGVNQVANFDLLKGCECPTQSCADGSCLVKMGEESPDMIGHQTGKLSPDQVNYREATEIEKDAGIMCGTCRFFNAGMSTCDLVTGTFMAGDWCSLFDPMDKSPVLENENNVREIMLMRKEDGDISFSGTFLNWIEKKEEVPFNPFDPAQTGDKGDPPPSRGSDPRDWKKVRATTSRVGVRPGKATAKLGGTSRPGEDIPSARRAAFGYSDEELGGNIHKPANPKLETFKPHSAYEPDPEGGETGYYRNSLKKLIYSAGVGDVSDVRASDRELVDPGQKRREKNMKQEVEKSLLKLMKAKPEQAGVPSQSITQDPAYQAGKTKRDLKIAIPSTSPLRGGLHPGMQNSIEKDRDHSSPRKKSAVMKTERTDKFIAGLKPGTLSGNPGSTPKNLGGSSSGNQPSSSGVPATRSGANLATNIGAKSVKKSAPESLQALRKFNGGIATLANQGGREAEHHQTLREYGFPSEQPPEGMRYVPVIETETNDWGCPINLMPPWVVNEAGQHLGETHPEDSPMHKMEVSDVLFSWLEKAGVWSPRAGGVKTGRMRMRVDPGKHAALGKPPKSKRGFRAF